MNSFDPMAAAVDWLDAYRASALSIVDMYAIDASLECDCGGRKVLFGRAAITEYWRRRFVETPTGELENLQPDGDDVVVSYSVPDGIVQAVLQFDGNGKLKGSRCGPSM